MPAPIIIGVALAGAKLYAVLTGTAAAGTVIAYKTAKYRMSSKELTLPIWEEIFGAWNGYLDTSSYDDLIKVNKKLQKMKPKAGGNRLAAIKLVDKMVKYLNKLAEEEAEMTPSIERKIEKFSDSLNQVFDRSAAGKAEEKVAA